MVDHPPRHPVPLLASLTLVLAVLGHGPLAHASDDSFEAAQRAFEEGLALMKAGDHEQACPKLEESQRIQAGMGTLFRLAECYEAIGKLTSAWRNYLEVAAAARAEGKPKRETYARHKADELLPRLSRFAVTVPSEVASVDGLTLEHNGALVPVAQWGGFPVDKGVHRLEAKAPGKKAWSVELEIASEGQVLKVRVPPLEDDDGRGAPANEPTAAEAPSPDGATPQQEGGEGLAIAGWVVAGVGVAAIGVSVGLGFAAKSQYDDSEPLCDGDACSQKGFDIRADARDLATVSTVVFGVGATAVVAGVVMWLVAPSGSDSDEAEEQVSWSLAPTSDGVGLAAEARW